MISSSFFFSFFLNLDNMPSTSTSAISNMANGKEKVLPSFWLPSQSPAAKISKLQKPDSTILCPVSEKPLRAKDLIDVKFTLVNDPDDKKSLIVKDNRYMCAVTHDILNNSVPCVLLRPTYVLLICFAFFNFFLIYKKTYFVSQW